MLTAALLLGVVLGLLCPRAARYGSPRAPLVIIGAAALHVASVPVTGRAETALLVASVAIGLVWIALQPRHLASVLLAAGVVLNIVVVLANGGMPVDPAALSAVGRELGDVTGSFFGKHVLMDDRTRFAWLGDRIPVPVQRNVVSIGDVVMAVAIVLWLADSVGGARHERRSTSAVNGEHRRAASRELADGDAS